ncbi:MAG TPA: diaminopimelate epimerase [Elusimicrobiota bacterium]|nr:diaminopimelate epimerase [Elusimicrobiota bacterium]
MRLSFSKMAGAGNDFILLEKTPKISDEKRLARRLCDRRRGIGADGLLIVDAGAGTPRLAYFNADGSTAFCGNGTRCAAWWLYRRGKIRGRNFILETSAGPVRAKIAGNGRAAILMPAPGRPRLGLKIRAGGRVLKVHWIRAGVPHAVVETKDPASAPVQGLGPLLRRHRAFGREGANVDFVRFDKNRAVLRTFERGVEAETLACGTGAVAAACVGRALGRLRGDSVRVLTAGGDVLRVDFKPSRGGGRSGAGYDIWLEGPAAEIFSGEINP